MTPPNFFQRIWLALVLFFRIIFDPLLAAQAVLLREGRLPEGAAELPEKPVAQPLPEARPEPKPEARPQPPPAPPKPAAADPSSALHLLAILQREGRFVDFVQEDISGADDVDVGAAARLVHTGCRKALESYFTLEPLRTEGEGARITVEKGFDPSAVRLTGNVTGEPPFAGALRHHGWKAADVRLPPSPAGQDMRVVAPAEVEL